MASPEPAARSGARETPPPAAPTRAGLDAAEAYRACAARVERVVADSADRLLEPVGACPGWSVRDVLGHLVGIADDWSSGRLERHATPGWTAVQVNSMAHLDIEALFARWRTLIDALDDVPAHAMPGTPWRRLAGDALCHEADLAETLGSPMPPLVAVQFGLDSIIPRWRAVLDAASAPPLELRQIGLRPRPVGRRKEAGELCAMVTTDPIELWRALYGRRVARRSRPGPGRPIRPVARPRPTAPVHLPERHSEHTRPWCGGSPEISWLTPIPRINRARKERHRPVAATPVGPR